MARTTHRDRARKSRVREHEKRLMDQRMRKLENITEAQLASLKKIKASEASQKPVKATSVADWRDLKDMGAVREQDGVLVLTSLGAQVATQNE